MTPPAEPKHRCPTCGTQELLAVVVVSGTSPVALLSCDHCDQRWWAWGRRSVSLSSVLPLFRQAWATGYRPRARPVSSEARMASEPAVGPDVIRQVRTLVQGWRRTATA